ncbi:MAG: YqeG family HAD IIIA-type phosphatase [Bacilli bacterium]|nr:YqeG family HAD IIIA-type phosphatase [Bacilli bacterium]
MFQLFNSLDKFIPYDCYQDVFSINYNKLYESGKRIILMDIDNTLIPYDIKLPSLEIKAFIDSLKKIGFEIILISNNNKKRVQTFSEPLGLNYINNALKPFGRGYRKAVKLVSPYTKKEIIAVGDQIMTDVLGANRHGVEVILVKPLKKQTEKWYTKVNRRQERKVLEKIKHYYPEEYRKIERFL